MIKYMICKYPFPFCELAFHSVDSLLRHQVLNFDEVLFIAKSSVSFPLLSSVSVMVLSVEFSSLIHVEFICMYGVRQSSVAFFCFDIGEEH